MSATNDGGPAFPADMTLRDWFAGQALAGIIAGSSGMIITAAEFSAQAYLVAAAMLAEKAKRGRE